MARETLEFKTLTVSLLAILSFITIFSNTVCIYIITKSKELSRTPSSYLIRSLLTVHLLQGVVVFPLYSIKKIQLDSLELYQIICDAFRFMYMVSFYAVIYSIVLIALDRLIAVLYIMDYRRIVTKFRVITCIVVLWTYIILLCLVPFRYPEGHPEMEGFFGELHHILHPNHYGNVTNLLSKCRYNQSQIWSVSMLIYNCVLPYIFIVIVYQIINMKIKRHQNKTKKYLVNVAEDLNNTDNHSNNCNNDNINNNNTNNNNRDDNINNNNNRDDDINNNNNNNNNSSNNKLDLIVRNNKDNFKEQNSKQNKTDQFNITKVSFLISAVYFITWLPSVIYYILWSVCADSCFSVGFKQSTTEAYVAFFTKYLAFFDAIASPAIYCLYSVEFRSFMRFWKKRKKWSFYNVMRYHSHASNTELNKIDMVVK